MLVYAEDLYASHLKKYNWDFQENVYSNNGILKQTQILEFSVH